MWFMPALIFHSLWRCIEYTNCLGSIYAAYLQASFNCDNSLNGANTHAAQIEMIKVGVFWRFLHTAVLLIYACLWWIYSEFSGLKSFINCLWPSCVNSTEPPFIISDKPLTTLNHIAFVIYEDNLSIPALCQLILLCTHFQIDEISVSAKSSKRLFISFMY